MIKSELVDKIARETPGLSNADAERVVRSVFDAIKDHVANGGRVELRGFGAFSVRQRNPRQGRNPKTGEPVAVSAKSALHFKMARSLRVRMNDQ